MKNSVFRFIMFSLPIVAFNVLFFLIGGTKHHPTSVWVAYTAIHLAWLICLCTPLLFNKSEHPVNQHVLSSLSLAFFVLQMAVGIIIILIAPSSYIWPLVVEVVLFVVFLVALFGLAWMNNIDSAKEKERVANREVSRQHSLRVKLLMGKVQDPTLRQQLQRCYDQLMRTPVKNNASVAQLNSDMDAVLDSLEPLLSSPEAAAPIVSQLKQLITQREEVLKFTH